MFICVPCLIFYYSQTHLTFGHDFTTAVELKQVAQQEAERARFLVEKVRDVGYFASVIIGSCGEVCMKF